MGIGWDASVSLIDILMGLWDFSASSSTMALGSNSEMPAFV